MPNPLYLKVMGVGINEYNSYSPAKKTKFQEVAREKLAELHQSNPTGYTELTEQPTETVVEESENYTFGKTKEEK
jgi:hypothetical protein